MCRSWKLQARFQVQGATYIVKLAGICVGVVLEEVARNGGIFNGLALGLGPAASDCGNKGEDGLEKCRLHACGCGCCGEVRVVSRRTELGSNELRPSKLISIPELRRWLRRLWLRMELVVV